MDRITLIATAKFGLEMVVKQELLALGYDELQVSDGRVQFQATLADIPRTNLWLRAADRVLLKMAEFKTTSFDDLYEQTIALPWEDWITEDGEFTVNATAVKSQLQSERTCQSIVKKAVVDRLKAHYQTEWFAETGPAFTIQISIHKDISLLTLDTSGVGLHKRGYRAEAGAAPLKETLAAALVMLSYWHKDRLLLDPLCGSGTILIEAALMARNIAPGLKRSFAAEAWPVIAKKDWKRVREEAATAVDRKGQQYLYGSDSDAASIAIAQQNAHKAGVGEDIQFEQKDVRDLWIDRQHGILISNPPYGRRLAVFKEINQIYITLNKIFRKKRGWSVYILTADKQFPRYFKRGKPDRVRKLYNGNIRVNYYQYYGEKPPAN